MRAAVDVEQQRRGQCGRRVAQQPAVYPGAVGDGELALGGLEQPDIGQRLPGTIAASPAAGATDNPDTTWSGPATSGTAALPSAPAAYRPVQPRLRAQNRTVRPSPVKAGRPPG
jgi:hypothetical protein